MSVVAIGEIVVDWLSVNAGTNRSTAVEFVRHLGGNAANVAIAFARLGGRSCLIGKVGHDFHAEFLKDILRRENVDLKGLIDDPRHPTAQCYVFTDQQGCHSFYNWPQPNAASMLCPAELTGDLLEGGRFLHATGISLTSEPRRSAIEKAVKLAHEKNMIVSFDAGFPTGEDEQARKTAEQFLKNADLLKVNLPELIFWSKENRDLTYVEMAQVLFEKYRPRLLAVTLSALGCILVSKAGLIECPGHKIKAVDEVGSGDAFMAGLLYAFAEHLNGSVSCDAIDRLSVSNWQQIGNFANAVGARTAEKFGAIEGLPRLPEVLSLISSDGDKCP